MQVTRKTGAAIGFMYADTGGLHSSQADTVHALANNLQLKGVTPWYSSSTMLLDSCPCTIDQYRTLLACVVVIVFKSPEFFLAMLPYIEYPTSIKPSFKYHKSCYQVQDINNVNSCYPTTHGLN